MPGEEQCLPKCLPLGHEACSTGDVVSKCRCKNQLRNPEHKLEQVGDRPGVIAGTCVCGHQAAGQASISYPQSKKDGQIFCERGLHGTCCTCVGLAPSESQHVPMCTEVGNCPGRSPILLHCQWPYSARPKTHAWLWNHQEQLKTPGVSHPGQEIQAESQKGRKWTDYACQYGYRCRSLWNPPNHDHPALCNQCWPVAGHQMKSYLPLHFEFWCEHAPHNQGREQSHDTVPLSWLIHLVQVQTPSTTAGWNRTREPTML